MEELVLRADAAVSTPGIPMVNMHKLSKAADGYRLTSYSRLLGNSAAQSNWTEQGALRTQYAEVAILFRNSDTDAGMAFLTKENEGCDSVANQLEVRFADMMSKLENWTSFNQWPRVALHLSIPPAGVSFSKTSIASDLRELTLHASLNLPDARSCDWLRHWVSDVVELIGHEYVHMYMFERFDGQMDLLSNEFAAYMVQLCIRHRATGRLADRVVVFPGFASDFDSALNIVEQGKLNTGLSGFFLADAVRRIKFGDRALEMEDLRPMERLCASEIRNPIDPRNRAEVQRLVSQ